MESNRITANVNRYVYSLRLWLCLSLTLLVHVARCQEKDLSTYPRKGSYLYYGQPAFEDNSFLLEEAFNQPMGVIQHISNLVLDNMNKGNMIYSFTQEIPIKDLTHQLSYTLFYDFATLTKPGSKSGGFGDVILSYRPALLGEKDWAMVIPRFSVIIPTGKTSDGHGYGGWGAQFNLAVTKRLSSKVVTHHNVGYTYVSHADKYLSNSTGVSALAFEKDLAAANIGSSIVWYPKRMVNLFLEYTYNFTGEIRDDGGISNQNLFTINPGVRFCRDNGRMQLVPGVSFPCIIQNGTYSQTGIFFYLSIEPDYLSFYKAKGE